MLRLFVYSMLLSFAAFSMLMFLWMQGPNATTFVTPVELFTTKYRSTLHGLSAASGRCTTPETRAASVHNL